MIGRHPRRGNSAILAALMLVPLSMLAGIGIDFGRAYVAGARLSQAVDAAALAGGRVLGAKDAAVDARMYFDSNFRADSEQVRIDRFEATPGDNNRILTVRARGTIATTFLQLANWNTLPIAASATARRTTMGMELALVLDVTGSMETGNAIGALRSASADLLNILFGPQSSIDTLWVSVVPYVASVNIGTNRTGWLVKDSLDQTLYAPHQWRGCVEARATPDDESDEPPGTSPFRPFYWESTLGKYTPKGDNDWGASKPPTDEASIDPKKSFTNNNNNTGPNLGCGQPIAGLDNNRDRLLAIVGSLRTASRTGTMAPLGLQAGWATISPRWRGLWGTNVWGSATPAGLPFDYDTPYMQKVIVMMTDGNNNWYDWPDALPDSDYTAYGRRSEGRLGVTSAGAATTEINNRMLRMCSLIKARHITIYTITLQTGSALSTETKDLYRKCASQPSFYFDTPSTTQLRGVFQQIGTQLSNLRLEK